MKKIEKYERASASEVDEFIEEAGFILPEGFLDFYRDSNGGEISSEDVYCMIWPLNELIELNKEYNVKDYAPDFFIFGSNGAGTAYVIRKDTGTIFEMPFIGMSNTEAVYNSNSFGEFLNKL